MTIGSRAQGYTKPEVEFEPRKLCSNAPAAQQADIANGNEDKRVKIFCRLNIPQIKHFLSEYITAEGRLALMRCIGKEFI